MKYFLAQLIKKDSIPQTTTDGSIQTALNIVFVVVGALAFFMLVLAGFRYILYGSDPNKLSEAKRQIIYALIGIIVVAAAATLVNFIIGRVG